MEAQRQPLQVAVRPLAQTEDQALTRAGGEEDLAVGEQAPEQGDGEQRGAEDEQQIVAGQAVEKT